MEEEIAYTRKVLEDAEWFWRQEVDTCARRLEDCHAAAYLVADEVEIDCSKFAYDLEEAESQLARIHATQREVEGMVARYRPLAAEYAKMLDFEGFHTREFLTDLIEALEEYWSVRLSKEAGRAIGTGVAIAASDIMRIIRRVQRDLRQVAGDTGERISAQILSGSFALRPLTANPSRGFHTAARVPGVPLLVVEQDRAREGDISEEDVQKLITDLSPDRPPDALIVTQPATGLADIFARVAANSWRRIRAGVSPTEPMDDATLDEPETPETDTE